MARVLSRGRRGALTPLNFQTRRRDVVSAASRFAGIDWKFTDGRYRAIPGIDYDETSSWNLLIHETAVIEFNEKSNEKLLAKCRLYFLLS